MDTEYVVSVELPSSWEALDQRQLRFVYTMTALYSDRPDAWKAVAVRLALKILGARLVSPYGDGFICRIQGRERMVTPIGLYPVIGPISWLSEIPDFPVRLDRIGTAVAMEPDPTPELTFAQWISLENLYQGYLYTQDASLLREMAYILYRSESITPFPGELISVYYWWTSVKKMVAARFPYFFKPAPVSGDIEPPDADELRRSVDAQIRALTKGDVTKEEQILSLPADRALTELDALAREYAELNKKYPQKN